MNKKVTESIIKPLISIFIVGLFLIALVGTNEVIETFKAKENYQLANYNTIVHYLEAFSEYDLDDETSQKVLTLMCGIADEVNANANDNTAIGVYSIANNQFMSNDDSDTLLPELIQSIDPGNRKIKLHSDYYNTEYGDYRLILRIEHEGIINILLNNNIYKKLFISSSIFAFLSIALIIFLQNDSNLKYRRVAGIIFIFIWIGSITITSAFDLNNQQKRIVDDEVNHVTSLIEFYYRQDLIEHGDEIEDRREFAQSNIDNFKMENGNILNIELNDNYHDDLDELDGCLTVTVNENIQKNKQLEFILSSVLFLALAIILYDKLSERILTDIKIDDDSLKKIDKKIITVQLINISGNALTWAITLPRLLEVARFNFGDSGTSYVASVYSLAIIVSMIGSILSSSINRLLKNIKYYYMLTYICTLIGVLILALFNNLVYATLGYILIRFAGGMANMLTYFYVAGIESKQRKDSILISSFNNNRIGESVGIIVGGVLGSIFRYRTVLLSASVLIIVSTSTLLLTKSSEYSDLVENGPNSKFDIKSLLKKKESFLYLMFIVVPLAFSTAYVDYTFPIDILSLGLTTAVIAFISMVGRLVSAYTTGITYPKLKKKKGLENMTYIYLVGLAILMLIYQLKTSIALIILITIGMGVLDSFGMLSYRERFIEIAEKEEISENDSNVLIKTGYKLGISIGPSLINLASNAIVLPITMIGSFIAYRLLSRKNSSS